MTKTMKKRIQKFTIVEILVAMSVFAILMLIIMQIFGSLQSVWTTTSNRTQTAQNANIIMNMLAADFQSAYYNMDADIENTWCYNQKNETLSDPLWFVTSRSKSVQSASSARVQTAYYYTNVTKDGISLKALKNLTVSNVKYEGVSGNPYNFNEEKTPPSIDSSLDKAAVLLDDNIVSITITPYVKEVKSSTGAISYVKDTPCIRLPAYVEIKLQMLDDDSAVREKYNAASTESEKNGFLRTYTRIIEVNRGQYYEKE